MLRPKQNDLNLPMIVMTSTPGLGALIQADRRLSPLKVYFWIDSVPLSGWEDWHYASAKLEEAYLDNVQSVYLYDGDLAILLRIATWED